MSAHIAKRFAAQLPLFCGLLFAVLLLAACGTDSMSAPASGVQQTAQSRPQQKTAAASYQDVVQYLYIAYFGRPADPTGLANFEAALAAAGAPTTIAGLNDAYGSNAAVTALVNSFETSAESVALYGSGSATDFITAIYSNVLGRAPDSGAQFWITALANNKLTRGDAALSIIAGALVNTSTQGLIDQQLVQNRLAVAEYFTAQVTSQGAVNAYAGTAAAASARTMLSGVNSNTNTTSYQATAGAEVGTLIALALSGAASSNIVLVPVNPLPSATVGSAYANTVVLGISPSSTYTYSIDTLANGSLPTGMTLGQNGVLSGTPFATGATDVNGDQVTKTYTFGVCATDTISRNTSEPCPQASITVYPIALTVTLAGTGAGMVSSSPAGISCGTDCSVTFDSGASVTLTAVAAGGSSFTGWSGACSGTSTCVVTFNAAASVTATFTFDTSVPTASFGAYSCVPTDSDGEDLLTYSVVIDGPVGTYIEDMSSSVYNIVSCGAWEIDPLSPYACERGANDPASATVSFDGEAITGSWIVYPYFGASGYVSNEISESISCP